MEFDLERHVALDVETYSAVNPEYKLQPFRRLHGAAIIKSIALTWWDGSKLVSKAWLRPSRRVLKSILVNLAKERKIIVGWNTPFDVAWLLAEDLDDEVWACQWADGMLLWRHATVEPEPEGRRKKPWGLKECVAQEYPQYAGYEEGVDFDADDEASIARLLEYNKLDTNFTFRLARKWWNRLNDRQQRVARIEAASIPMFAKTYLQGILIDQAAMRKLHADLNATAAQAYNELAQSDTGDVVVNKTLLASPTQLRHLLFDVWGLPIIKQTDKGADSTDKEVLHELSFLDPRAKVLRTYREAVNNNTKFVVATGKSLEYNGDGRVRPIAKIYGTYTSRVTYSSKQGKGKNERPTGVALHQWKRAKEFRDEIAAPEGFDLCEFDFASQEFRWMAVESGDETMLGLCQPGEDAHTYMGYRIWVQDEPDLDFDYRGMIQLVHDAVPAAKDHRQLGKVANLSLQYRTSANKLRSVARVQYNIPMTPEQAQRIHGTYPVTYSGVPRYWEKQIALGRSQGYIENLAGRRVQLRGDWSNRNEAWGLQSTAINFPIQGIGGDQKYLALMVLRDYLPTIGGYLYFELHDGLYLLLPKKNSRAEAVKIRHMLSSLPYKKAWGVDLPIAFPVDAKIGPRWGDLVEMKEA